MRNRLRDQVVTEGKEIELVETFARVLREVFHDEPWADIEHYAKRAGMRSHGLTTAHGLKSEITFAGIGLFTDCHCHATSDRFWPKRTLA